eukprot:3900209-Rhodomonas_salina.1
MAADPISSKRPLQTLSQARASHREVALGGYRSAGTGHHLGFYSDQGVGSQQCCSAQHPGRTMRCMSVPDIAQTPRYVSAGCLDPSR